VEAGLRHSVFIPGVPVAGKPPRFSVRGKYPIVHKHPEVKAWQDLVAFYAGLDMPTSPLEGGLRLTLWCYFAPPAKAKNRERMFGKPVSVKPDCDNLSKPILDGLADAGYFAVGDQQVTDERVIKRYCPDDKVGVLVIIERDEGMDAPPSWVSELAEVHG